MADRPATSVWNPPEPKAKKIGPPIMNGRCHYCKSRMKKILLTPATHCRKCGRIQPWAEENS